MKSTPTIQYPPVRAARGFTLVELLLTMTLFSIIMLIATVILRNSLDILSFTSSRVASDRIAAGSLEQIALDIHQRVERREPTMRVVKNNGNDELVILTGRRGYPELSETAERQVSTVHYRVENNKLRQAASGYRYGEIDIEPGEAGNEGSLKLFDLPAMSPEDLPEDWFIEFMPGVLRLEFSFMNSGENSTISADPPANLSETTAIIINVVVLDPRRSRALSDSQLELIAAQFEDASNNTLLHEVWSETALDLVTTMPTGSVPLDSLRHVRAYQHIVPLSLVTLQ